MASTRIAVDAEGDLILRLRSDPSPAASASHTDSSKAAASHPVELRVSSKVMSLASPFFRVILDGKFKEGAEFSDAARASREPYALDLPEDDGEAATILARILHFDVKDIAPAPNSECLEQLAFLCDKYQCADVLRFCGAVWLRDWMIAYEATTPVIEDLCRLLVFAYVADLAMEFNDVAWKLFLHHRGPLLGPYTQAGSLLDHPLLQQDIGRLFDAERFKCCGMLHKGIMSPLERAWSTQDSGCFRAAKAIGLHLKRLREAGLMPYDLEFSTDRFTAVFDKANSLLITNLSQFECSVYRCTCQNELGTWLTTDLREQVRLIKEKHKDFMCLDCIKTDGVSAAEETCRLKHKRVVS